MLGLNYLMYFFWILIFDNLYRYALNSTLQGQYIHFYFKL